VALVLGSVGGVVALITAVDTRVTVLAAASVLVPGDRVERDDLVERSVSLDGADRLYLSPRDIPDGGFVVVGTVREGELVPRSAVTDSAGHGSTVVVIEPASALSESVRAGTPVEIWASPADPDSDRFGAPSVLVQNAMVARIVDGGGLVAGASGGAVEVQVERSRIARILQAQADGDLLVVVPAGRALGE